MIDLQDVKDYLGITNNDDDQYLQQQIDAAEAMVKRYCGREFDEVVDQAQMIASPERHLFLTRFPISSITSITDSDNSNSGVVPGSMRYSPA